MTCRELIDFLGDYLANALPPPAREEFEKHLAECPDCRHYLESYKAAIELGRAALGASDEPVPAQVPEDLVKAILAARADSKRSSS